MKPRIKEPFFNQKYWDIVMFSCDFITFYCFLVFDELAKFGVVSAGQTRLTLLKWKQMLNYNRNEINILNLFKNKEKYSLSVAIPFFKDKKCNKKKYINLSSFSWRSYRINIASTIFRYDIVQKYELKIC